MTQKILYSHLERIDLQRAKNIANIDDDILISYIDADKNFDTDIKKLSNKYTLISYTAKAKPDRMLINGKTGTELVWEWLKKYKFDKYISKVTSEKPRAVAYIDDKAIKFNDWDSCLKDLEKGDII